MKQLQRKKRQTLLILILGTVIIFVSNSTAVCANPPLTTNKGASGDISFYAQQGLLLDANERAWLKKNKTIKVGTSQYPPLSYMDESDSFVGISADYLKLISEKTGLLFEAQYLAWPELMKQSKSKGVDLFSGLKNPDRVKYLNFTEPYLSVSYVVINRLKTPFFSDFSNLNGQKVAVVRNWTVHKLIETKFPAIDIVPFDTVPQALKAVATRRAEAYIGDLLTANYQIQKNVLTNLKVAAPAPFKDDFVRFATRKDWPELSTILDKCIRSIPKEQHDIIINNWLQLRFETGFNWLLFGQWAGGGGTVLLLCIFLVISWNRRLSMEILARTKKLKESEEKFKAIFNQAAVGVARVALDGTWLEVNKKLSDIVGYSYNELLLKNFQDITHSDDLQTDLDYINQLLVGEIKTYSMEKRYLKKNGDIVWINLTVSLVRDKNNDPDYFISIIEDITERKRAEAELEKYQNHLEHIIDERNMEIKTAQRVLVQKEKLAAIGKLSGSVAHDIRNPLGVISNSVYFLNRVNEDITEEQLRKHLRIMEMEVFRANNIITDLMDFSRENIPAFSEGDINNLIKDLLVNFIIPDNITMELDLATNLPLFFFDSSQIQRSFHNLVTNAIQAMPKGGKLQISSAERNDTVVIKIRDTGVGMSSDDIKDIFEPLFTTKSKGVGLGLSIVKTFLEKHNGTVEVESEISKGSEFIITLPIRRENISWRE